MVGAARRSLNGWLGNAFRSRSLDKISGGAADDSTAAGRGLRGGGGDAIAIGIWQRGRFPKKPPRALNLSKIRYPYPELGITIENYPRVDGSTSTQPCR